MFTGRHLILGTSIALATVASITLPALAEHPGGAQMEYEVRFDIVDQGHQAWSRPWSTPNHDFIDQYTGLDDYVFSDQDLGDPLGTGALVVPDGSPSAIYRYPANLDARLPHVTVQSGLDLPDVQLDVLPPTRFLKFACSTLEQPDGTNTRPFDGDLHDEDVRPYGAAQLAPEDGKTCAQMGYVSQGDYGLLAKLYPLDYPNMTTRYPGTMWMMASAETTRLAYEAEQTESPYDGGFGMWLVPQNPVGMQPRVPRITNRLALRPVEFGRWSVPEGTKIQQREARILICASKQLLTPKEANRLGQTLKGCQPVEKKSRTIEGAKDNNLCLRVKRERFSNARNKYVIVEEQMRLGPAGGLPEYEYLENGHWDYVIRSNPRLLPRSTSATFKGC